MKTALIVLFLIFSNACAAQSQKVVENPKPKTENQSKQIVLVELFTSEG